MSILSQVITSLQPGWYIDFKLGDSLSQLSWYVNFKLGDNLLPAELVCQF